MKQEMKFDFLGAIVKYFSAALEYFSGRIIYGYGKKAYIQNYDCVIVVPHWNGALAIFTLGSIRMKFLYRSIFLKRFY